MHTRRSIVSEVHGMVGWKIKANKRKNTLVVKGKKKYL